MRNYVDDDHRTVFICPGCNIEQYINIKDFDKKTLNIKCSCGKITTISLEYRRYFRKNVSILGKVYTKTFKNDIFIVDLSVQGIKFRLVTKSKFYDSMNIGDIINVAFTLNGVSIIKKCKLKNKYDEHLGVQFMNENFSRNIGFYLM